MESSYSNIRFPPTHALRPSTVETFPILPAGIGLEYELQHGDGETIRLYAVRDERRKMWLREVLLLLPKPVGHSPLPRWPVLLPTLPRSLRPQDIRLSAQLRRRYYRHQKPLTAKRAEFLTKRAKTALERKPFESALWEAYLRDLCDSFANFAVKSFPLRSLRSPDTRRTRSA